MEYSKQEYLKTYEFMIYSRLFEEICEEYVMKGIAGGFHHLGLGDEAVGVGAFSELGPNDWIVPEHRSRPMLSKKFGEHEFISEMLAKPNGMNAGMAGDTHYFVPDKKAGPYSGLLGQTQAMAAGIALNYKLDKIDGCVVIGCGDGTLNEGVIAEALTMIAAWKLPVVWYVQNNSWGMSMPAKKINAINDLSERGLGFGLPSASYDGNDVFLVRDVMREAMAKARKGEPQFIEFKTTRWSGHFVGDPQQYRDLVEVEDAKANKDCVKWCRNYLLVRKIATAEELDTIDAAQSKNLYAAFDAALAEPDKTPEDILDPGKIFAK
ncbi:Acetoin:2,6-dichlorophenolindophenol oxidoreductase subunit alpha [Sporomusa silvacetica DSM 10669]|uniref:Acetoin:2,6-dichlorophenolindophenol oxidoreductase subunit alpha n=1 Tax=Sporomusa silvacetica DSM 10669 TaxID=1123289 RepID=A0ABZ3IKN3_9FIRM|nr:thiamine pyrophosphate-dependent dehydrogenase E1 component subunit alpha [Sporomusa silvacetica]OZC13458.1 acetoin:2,6-dichlorophenolindophenol oxidoreductase subunit alpha [Sporomusa silvacetica DSM 10669]